MGHKQSVESSAASSTMPTATDVVGEIKQQDQEDTNDTNLTSGADETSQTPTEQLVSNDGGNDAVAIGGRRPKRSATLRPLGSSQSALIQREEEELKKAIQASLQEVKRAKARERAIENGQLSDNSNSQASTSTRPAGKRIKNSICSSASSTASNDVARSKSSQQRKFAHDSPGNTGHRTPVRKSSIPKPTQEVFQAIRPQPDDFLTYLCFRKIKSTLPPHLDLESKNRQALLEKRKREAAREAARTPLSCAKFLPSSAQSRSLDGSARKTNNSLRSKTATANATVTRKLSLDSTPSKQSAKKLSPLKSESSTLKSNPFTKNIVEKAKKFSNNTSNVNKNKSEPTTVAEKLRAAANFNTPSNKKSASTTRPSLPTIVFPKLADSGRSMRNSTRTITLATNNFVAARDLINGHEPKASSPSPSITASTASTPSKPTPPKKSKLTSNQQHSKALKASANSIKSKSAPATPAKRLSRSTSSTSGKSQEDIESERHKIRQLILEIERQHELERRHSFQKPTNRKRQSSSDSSSSDSEEEPEQKPPPKKLTKTHNSTAAKMNNNGKQTTQSNNNKKSTNSTLKRNRSPIANHISTNSHHNKGTHNKQQKQSAPIVHQKRDQNVTNGGTSDSGNSRSVRSSTKTITLATKKLIESFEKNRPQHQARRTSR